MRVLQKTLIFALIAPFLTGFGVAFSQTPTQSETLQVGQARQAAIRLFEDGKAAHDGNGVPQDFEKARKLYLLAADFGSTQALINLGYLYFTGQGVESDFVKARKYYEMAAKRGSKDAKENLKMMDARGLGILPIANPKAPANSQKPPQLAKSFETRNRVEPTTSIQQIAPSVEALKSEPRSPVIKTDASVAKVETAVLDAIGEAPARTSSKEVELGASAMPEPKLTAPILEMAEASPLPRSAVKPTIQQGLGMSQKPVRQNPSSIFAKTNMLLALLLGLAVLVLLVHLLYARKQTREREVREQFVQLFYDAKRNDIRLTYLRRRDSGFVHANFHEEWQATLTVLMARFALYFDEPDEALRAFCKKLNHGLSLNLRPTKYLASEFSDKMLGAALSEIKAVDAFQRASLSEGSDVLSSNTKLSQGVPTLHGNVVKLFQRKSGKAK